PGVVVGTLDVGPYPYGSSLPPPAMAGASRMPGPLNSLPPSSAAIERPGGSAPPMRQDAMLIVFETVKPIGVISLPACTVTGPFWDATRTVAPARECIAPRPATAASAERTNVPIGEAATNSPAAVATRTAGV